MKEIKKSERKGFYLSIGIGWIILSYGFILPKFVFANLTLYYLSFLIPIITFVLGIFIVNKGNELIQKLLFKD